MASAVPTSPSPSLLDRLRTASSGPLFAQLVAPADLAQALGVTERTLSSWRERGTGPAYVRTGERIVRYLPEDVDAWLRAQRFTGTAEERL
ncbi:AlpA family transcriptional regulator [Micrococcus sp. FDAARGOS_333]|uniref:helix-turn-helix transcriptional regulator n=1 Tax=Micrococcus sp. FDAARGOS_333 TaxID=1930558 RepID=UPI000B4E4102|nr:helix-turn-helix domain-containing protein [Micrococcus sp. FDAARGOS_333]PNL17284.1 DNA-binding protein [Micrococcus sp. FDAARGOS_333]